MSGEIDRVARAIAAERIKQATKTRDDETEIMASLVEKYYREYLPTATAAIAAMVGWREIDEYDIEKHGKEVLVALWLWNEPEKGRTYSMAYFSNDAAAWVCDEHAENDERTLYAPTHFMVPPPPEGAL